ENIELQVYGKISEEYLKKFEADKRIKFFGPIPNRDAPAKEKSFDLFVIPRPHHPSAETTTPIKLVEAMAAGSAILSTNVGGTTWLLKNGKNALVCEATPQAIAEAVIYAEKNPKKLEKMR
ncbi:MAG: glycosyltransferase, partial [Candidatus Micrarchaeia archaeon]